jgi:hypothetical protein
VDVAGGSGQLSCQLMLAGVPSLIVDPRPPNWRRTLTRLRTGDPLHTAILRLFAAQQTDHKNNAEPSNSKFSRPSSGSSAVDLGGQTLSWDGVSRGPYGPLRSVTIPSSLCTPFPIRVPNLPKTLPNFGEPKHLPVLPSSPKTETSEKLRLAAALAASSLVVGLHSDQPTEAILDYGLAHNKPVAVVPCCVFPELFSKRFITAPLSEAANATNSDDGHKTTATKKRQVRSYADFCRYLLAKSPLLRSERLDFEGRNLVIYYLPRVSVCCEASS